MYVESIARVYRLSLSGEACRCHTAVQLHAAQPRVGGAAPGSGFASRMIPGWPRSVPSMRLPLPRSSLHLHLPPGSVPPLLSARQRLSPVAPIIAWGPPRSGVHAVLGPPVAQHAAACAHPLAGACRQDPVPLAAGAHLFRAGGRAAPAGMPAQPVTVDSCDKAGLCSAVPWRVGRV